MDTGSGAREGTGGATGDDGSVRSARACDGAVGRPGRVGGEGRDVFDAVGAVGMGPTDAVGARSGAGDWTTGVDRTGAERAGGTAIVME